MTRRVPLRAFFQRTLPFFHDMFFHDMFFHDM
jgi:hypothetical protein